MTRTSEQETDRAPRWKKAIGWGATIAILCAMLGSVVVTAMIALVGWPLSDPASRGVAQGILMMGGALLATVLLLGAAINWGPLRVEDSNDW